MRRFIGRVSGDRAARRELVRLRHRRIVPSNPAIRTLLLHSSTCPVAATSSDRRGGALFWGAPRKVEASRKSQRPLDLGVDARGRCGCCPPNAAPTVIRTVRRGELAIHPTCGKDPSRARSPGRRNASAPAAASSSPAGSNRASSRASGAAVRRAHAAARGFPAAARRGPFAPALSPNDKPFRQAYDSPGESRAGSPFRNKLLLRTQALDLAIASVGFGRNGHDEYPRLCGP